MPMYWVYWYSLGPKLSPGTGCRSNQSDEHSGTHLVPWVLDPMGFVVVPLTPTMVAPGHCAPPMPFLSFLPFFLGHLANPVILHNAGMVISLVRRLPALSAHPNQVFICTFFEKVPGNLGNHSQPFSVLVIIVLG